MIGIIKAAASFVAEAIGLADRPAVEKASNLAGIASTFARDAARHESDHVLALSGRARRRIADNNDYLRDGAVFPQSRKN
jgi:hypothetical protein